MSLTVNLDQATLDALQADAIIRKISCEEIISELLHDHYASPKRLSPKDEKLVNAGVEEGREAIRQLDFCANEEVITRLEEKGQESCLG